MGLRTLKSVWSVLIILIICTFLIESCDELEPVNPADPNYALKAPTLLSVQPITDIQIDIIWQNNEEYTEEFIIKRKAGSQSYTSIDSVAKDVLSYRDTTCSLGIEYNYYVVAKLNSNLSVNSNVLQAITEFQPPSDMIATAIGDANIEVIWTDNSNYELGYRLERDFGDGFMLEAELNANVTTYLDSGLSMGFTYSYRVQAYTYTNTSEYSSTATASTVGVVDIDGNVYNTIQIGEQIWMAENLNVTHYRDGSIIPNEANTTWTSISTGAYCYYGNNHNIGETYGALYNWYAINDERNVAPTGWHVPSYAEWETLIESFGGSSNAGGKMKEIGTTHWSDPNTGATNQSGFTALPGGYRYYLTGTFTSIGDISDFWSATEYNSSDADFINIGYIASNINYDTANKRNGFSVRCIKD